MFMYFCISNFCKSGHKYGLIGCDLVAERLCIYFLIEFSIMYRLTVNLASDVSPKIPLEKQ